MAGRPRFESIEGIQRALDRAAEARLARPNPVPVEPGQLCLSAELYPFLQVALDNCDPRTPYDDAIWLWMHLLENEDFRSVVETGGVDLEQCLFQLHNVEAAVGNREYVLRELAFAAQFVAGEIRRLKAQDRPNVQAAPIGESPPKCPLNRPTLDGFLGAPDPEIRAWVRAAADWTRRHGSRVLTVASLAATLDLHSYFWFDEVQRHLWLNGRWVRPVLDALEQSAVELHGTERSAGGSTDMAMSAELDTIWRQFCQQRPEWVCPQDSYLARDDTLLWKMLLDSGPGTFRTLLKRAGLEPSELDSLLDEYMAPADLAEMLRGLSLVRGAVEAIPDPSDFSAGNEPDEAQQ